LLFYFIISLLLSGPFSESKERTNFGYPTNYSNTTKGRMEKGSRFSAGEQGELHIGVVKNVISTVKS
jgi:hypothetical protein